LKTYGIECYFFTWIWIMLFMLQLIPDWVHSIFHCAFRIEHSIQHGEKMEWDFILEWEVRLEELNWAMIATWVSLHAWCQSPYFIPHANIHELKTSFNPYWYLIRIYVNTPWTPWVFLQVADKLMIDIFH
jgi:hypothetical protein